MGRSRLPAHVKALIPQIDRSVKLTDPSKRQRPAHWPPGVDSELEMALYTRLERHGLPLGVGQYRYRLGRNHRFDRAWPSHLVAVEVEGGVWSDEGHGRKSMVVKMIEKLSIAAALGWRVLPLTQQQIESGAAVRLIARALGLPRPR